MNLLEASALAKRISPNSEVLDEFSSCTFVGSALFQQCIAMSNDAEFNCALASDSDLR